MPGTMVGGLIDSSQNTDPRVQRDGIERDVGIFYLFASFFVRNDSVIRRDNNCLHSYVRQATSFGVSSLVTPDGISLRNMGSKQVVLRQVVSSVSHKKNIRTKLSSLRASVDIGAIKSKLSKSNIFLGKFLPNACMRR